MDAMADPINRVARYFEELEVISGGISSDVECILAEFTDAAIDFMETCEDDGLDLEDLSPDSPPIARLLDLIIKELRTLNGDRIVITPGGDTASVEVEVAGNMVERDRLPMRVFLPLAKRIADCSQPSAGIDGLTVRIYESDHGNIIEMRRKLN
jgi:hypothetical protein